MYNYEKGFALIELLAVMVILGILLVIAVPTSTTIVTNAKKKQYAFDALNFINTAKLESIYKDTNKTIQVYKIDQLEASNNKTSPFGEYLFAYVFEKCENKACKYYYISLDSSNYFLGKYDQDGSSIMAIEAKNIEINGSDVKNISIISGDLYSPIFSFDLKLKSRQQIESAEAYYKNLSNSFWVRIPEGDKYETVYVERIDNVVTTTIDNSMIDYNIGWEYKLDLIGNGDYVRFNLLKETANSLIFLQKDDLGPSNIENLQTFVKEYQDKWTKAKSIRLLNNEDLKPFVNDAESKFCHNYQCSTKIDKELLMRFNINQHAGIDAQFADMNAIHYTFLADDSLGYNSDGSTETYLKFTCISSNGDIPPSASQKVRVSSKYSARIKFVVTILKSDVDDIVKK